MSVVPRGWGVTGVVPQAGTDSLRKEHRRRKVVPQPQNDRDTVVPVQVLRVDTEQVPAREPTARRVQYVQRLVYQLAKLAEALVHGPHVGRLLARALQGNTCAKCECGFWW